MASMKSKHVDRGDHEIEEDTPLYPPRGRTPSPKRYRSPRRRIKPSVHIKSMDHASSVLELTHHAHTMESLGLIPLTLFKPGVSILLAKTALGDTIAIEGVDADVPIVKLKKHEYHPTLPQYSYPLIKTASGLYSDLIIVTGHGIQISRAPTELKDGTEVNGPAIATAKSRTVYYNYDEDDVDAGYHFKAHPLVRLDDIRPVRVKNTIGDALKAAIEGVDADAFREFALLCSSSGALHQMYDRTIRITLIVPVSAVIAKSSIGRSSTSLKLKTIRGHIVDEEIYLDDNSKELKSLDDRSIVFDAITGKINGSKLRDINMRFSNGIIHIVDDFIHEHDITDETGRFEVNHKVHRNVEDGGNDTDDDYEVRIAPKDPRKDSIDFNRICTALRDASLHIWEDELINMETNVNNILRPCIASIISNTSYLISSVSKHIDEPISIIVNDGARYHPPKSEVWGTDEIVDDASVDSSGAYEDALDYNRTIDGLTNTIGRMAAIRVEFDRLCLQLKSGSSELSTQVSRGRL